MTVSQDDTAESAKNKITVIPNKTGYVISEKMVFIITNGLTESFTLPDQQTYCSIIILEKQGQNEWQPIRNCTLNAPSLEKTIEAGSVTRVELTPSQQPSERIEFGTYRATLVFTIGVHYLPGKTQSVSSEPFTVQ